MYSSFHKRQNCHKLNSKYCARHAENVATQMSKDCRPNGRWTVLMDNLGYGQVIPDHWTLWLFAVAPITLMTLKCMRIYVFGLLQGSDF